jgi:hypothetical protein
MDFKWTLEELRKQGLTVRRKGENITVQPASRITPLLRIAIRNWKWALWFMAGMNTPELPEPPRKDARGQFEMMLEEKTQ